MKPDLWTTLADEVPAWVSQKRNRTSVDRTVRWLDECIDRSVVHSKHDFILFILDMIISSLEANRSFFPECLLICFLRRMYYKGPHKI